MEKEKPHFGSPNRSCRSGQEETEVAEVHQKAFEDIKKVMAKETILTHPNFNEVFEIHTDASDRQLGAVMGNP